MVQNPLPVWTQEPQRAPVPLHARAESLHRFLQHRRGLQLEL